MRRIRFVLPLALSASLLSGALPQARAEHVVADEHTLETPPLAPGQIELLTVSTFPDAVTGGDVLVELRGLLAGDLIEYEVNGELIPSFTPRPIPHAVAQIADGLVVGTNTITAIVRRAGGDVSTTLTVRNHPITGPVISGPHQTPFRCRTVDLGLGDPLDEDCSAPTIYQWFYFSSDDSAWRELADPRAPYPDDVATTETIEGRAVPFVARVETAIINRGVTRIAALDDPAALPPTHSLLNGPSNWNGKVYHSFGESCGVGYDQGRNSVDSVLGGAPNPDNFNADSIFANLVGLLTRVGEGDAVVHSTLTSFGNHCNPFVSIETAMMIKEHIIETYDGSTYGGQQIDRYIGTGSSGGALQQWNAANNAPGLLDAAMPGASFADIATTAMTVTDCGLFTRYFGATDLEWSELEKATVTGHNAQTGTSANSICQSWTDAFLDRIEAVGGCATSETRYHPVDNPGGARCTVQDANVNWLGRDPATGFARRPLDNVGVEYGLRALNAGTITFDQFADLNEKMGGFDIDGNHQAARHAMDPVAERLIYQVGQVIGRGALAETPVIDFAPYLDLIPVANIHESARPFIIRQRVRRSGGTGVGSMAMWRGLVVQSDGFEEIDAWVAAINAAPPGANRIAAVAAAKPLTAMDQCALGTVGGRVEATEGVRAPAGIPFMVAPGAPGPDADVQMRAFVPEDHESGIGPCSALLPPVTTTRIAAGGPASDDVIKCQLKAVLAGDYTPALNAAQLTRMQALFPDGVCDWSKPAAGDVEHSLRWPSLGGETPYLDGDGNPAPMSLTWRVARS